MLSQRIMLLVTALVCMGPDHREYSFLLAKLKQSLRLFDASYLLVLNGKEASNFPPAEATEGVKKILLELGGANRLDAFISEVKQLVERLEQHALVEVDELIPLLDEATGPLLYLTNSVVREFEREAQAILDYHRENLEQKIQERTEELNRRNEQMQLIFKNVMQGLAITTLDGLLGEERSAFFDDHFKLAEGQPVNLLALTANIDPNFSGFLSFCLSELRDEFMPADMVLAQAPQRLEVEGRTLEFKYVPMQTPNVPQNTSCTGVDGLLLMVSDITEKIAAERRDKLQREFALLVTKLIRDPEDLQDFMKVTTDTIYQLQRVFFDGASLDEVKFIIHTLKGNTSMFGLELLPQLLHAIEEKLVEGTPPSKEDIMSIERSWNDSTESITDLLRTETDTGVKLTKAEYHALLLTLERLRASPSQIRWFEPLRNEQVFRRLERIAASAQTSAEPLKKPKPSVAIVQTDLRLPSAPLEGFWAAFTHIVNIAIDHGIEPPSVRQAIGKSPEGTILISVEQSSEDLEIKISDDGAGINWEALRIKAQRLNIPSETKEDLETALFHPGVSSKTTTSLVSGRGLRTSVMKHEIEKLGGKILLSSQKDLGTRFTFRIPLKAIYPPNYSRFNG